MSDLSDERKNIQLEECLTRFAVSESWAQKIGKALNFINNRQHSIKEWNINGNYGVVTMPQSAIDGLHPFLKNATILDVYLLIEACGTAGDTEIDIKRSTASGGAFASIFTTKPKINFAAGSYVWVNLTSGGGAGLTVPVLSLTDLNAGDVLRLDMIQAQTGATVNGASVVLFHRPR